MDRFDVDDAQRAKAAEERKEAKKAAREAGRDAAIKKPQQAHD